MTTLQAVLWDVDGTLAETERDGHRVAFNRAFEVCGLPWRWSEARYGELLSINGGRERLLRDMSRNPQAPVMYEERRMLAARVHQIKNRYYAELVAAGQIRLRPGVRALLDQCLASGLKLGVVTTTSRSNLEALLQAHLGVRWKHWFSATVCGEDVRSKKPDPEGYRRALEQLRLSPLACVAIEDSPGGATAARAADLPVIVTRSHYFADDTIDGAIAIGTSLGQRQGWRPLPTEPDRCGGIVLDDLRRWHSQMDIVAHIA